MDLASYACLITGSTYGVEVFNLRERDEGLQFGKKKKARLFTYLPLTNNDFSQALSEIHLHRNLKHSSQPMLGARRKMT